MEKYIKPPEQNNTNSSKRPHQLHWAVECFLALIVYIALFYTMQFTLATTLLLIVPCVFVLVRRGWVAGIAFYVLCGAMTYLLHAQAAVVAAAIGLLPMLVCGYVVRSRQKPWACILASCGAALVSTGAAVLVLHYIAEGNIAKFMADKILKKAAQDPAMAFTVSTALISHDLANGLMSAEKAMLLMYTVEPLAYISEATSISLLKQMIEAMIPEMLVNYIAYGGLAGFYIPWLLAKYSEQRVAKFPPVETWQLPKQHGYYMAATCALGYVCMVFGDSALFAPAQMLFSLTIIAFCMVGASVVCFFLAVRVRARSGRVAIAVGLYLLLPGLLAAIGIMEQLFGIRKRVVIIKQPPKGGQNR